MVTVKCCCDRPGLVALGEDCGHVHSLMGCVREFGVLRTLHFSYAWLPSMLAHDLWYQYKADIEKLLPIVFESTQADPMYLYGHVHLVWKAQALHCAPPPQT